MMVNHATGLGLWIFWGWKLNNWTSVFLASKSEYSLFIKPVIHCSAATTENLRMCQYWYSWRVGSSWNLSGMSSMCLLSAVSEWLVLVGEAYFHSSEQQRETEESKFRNPTSISWSKLLWGYSSFHWPKRMVAKAAFLCGFILSYNKQSGPGLTNRNNYSFWTSILFIELFAFTSIRLHRWLSFEFARVQRITANLSMQIYLFRPLFQMSCLSRKNWTDATSRRPFLAFLVFQTLPHQILLDLHHLRRIPQLSPLNLVFHHLASSLLPRPPQLLQHNLHHLRHFQPFFSTNAFSIVSMFTYSFATLQWSTVHSRWLAITSNDSWTGLGTAFQR